jgi:hypothetical protein
MELRHPIDDRDWGKPNSLDHHGRQRPIRIQNTRNTIGIVGRRPIQGVIFVENLVDGSRNNVSGKKSIGTLGGTGGGSRGSSQRRRSHTVGILVKYTRIQVHEP